MKTAPFLGSTALALALALPLPATAARVAVDLSTGPALSLDNASGLTLARGRDDGRARGNSSDDDGTPDQGRGDFGGSGSAGSPSGSSSDDGTPDQGRGDFGSDDSGGRGGRGGDDNGGHGGDDHGGHGGHGGDDSGGHGGHGGHGGDDSGGHGSDHTSLFPLPGGLLPAFTADAGYETARRGRSKPRIPGGSGCDDPHDLIEHPECAG